MEGYKSEVGDKAREKCNHKRYSEPSIPSGQQQVTKVIQRWAQTEEGNIRRRISACYETIYM